MFPFLSQFRLCQWLIIDTLVFSTYTGIRCFVSTKYLMSSVEQVHSRQKDIPQSGWGNTLGEFRVKLNVHLLWFYRLFSFFFEIDFQSGVGSYWLVKCAELQRGNREIRDCCSRLCLHGNRFSIRKRACRFSQPFLSLFWPLPWRYSPLSLQPMKWCSIILTARVLTMATPSVGSWSPIRASRLRHAFATYHSAWRRVLMLKCSSITAWPTSSSLIAITRTRTTRSNCKDRFTWTSAPPASRSLTSKMETTIRSRSYRAVLWPTVYSMILWS